jgi:hypothetical protein
MFESLPRPLVVSCLVVAATLPGRAAQGPAAARSSGAAIFFRPVTADAGLHFQHVNGASPDKYMVETMGSGGLFFDYDRDGWIDVFLVDGGSIADRTAADSARHRLYRNRGSGTFEETTAASGIRHTAYGLGACAADVDSDGWLDLYITAFGPNVLYRNNGNRTFTDITQTAGVGSTLWSTSCAFGDIDNDGDVDLYVANYVEFSAQDNKFCGDVARKIRAYCDPHVYPGVSGVLYRNDGAGVFADITREAGVQRTDGKSLGVMFLDYDADGWPDIFVANDRVPNFLFHNQRDGRFREVGLLTGVAVASDGRARAGMGTDFGDYDNDGLPDLVVTNFDLETHSVFRNLGGGIFADATAESGVGPPTLPFVGFGTAWFDGDNDGDLDLAIANGHVLDNPGVFRAGARHAQRRLLFVNDGRGKLTEIGRSAGPGFEPERVGRGLAVADIDGDGDLDMLVTNNGQAVELLRNDGDSRGNALIVRLVGTKSNRDGIGARVRVTSGGRSWVRDVRAGSSYLGQNDLRVHVGVGTTAQADVEVRWPGGAVETVRGIAVNQSITVSEGRGITDRVAFAARR